MRGLLQCCSRAVSQKSSGCTSQDCRVIAQKLRKVSNKSVVNASRSDTAPGDGVTSMGAHRCIRVLPGKPEASDGARRKLRMTCGLGVRTSCVYCSSGTPRSSSGLGRRPLTPVTRVQIPYGVQLITWCAPRFTIESGAHQVLLFGALCSTSARSHARPGTPRAVCSCVPT